MTQPRISQMYFVLIYTAIIILKFRDLKKYSSGAAGLLFLNLCNYIHACVDHKKAKKSCIQLTRLEHFEDPAQADLCFPPLYSPHLERRQSLLPLPQSFQHLLRQQPDEGQQ